jgi:hypothetical protein
VWFPCHSEFLLANVHSGWIVACGMEHGDVTASGMSRIYAYRPSPFFLPVGWGDPGLICSIFARARSIFFDDLFDSGAPDERLGVSVPSLQNASIARFSSGTLTKLPRRIAFSVNSRNQCSTKFSQLELAGTTWHTNRALGSVGARDRRCGHSWPRCTNSASTSRRRHRASV